MRSVPGSEVKLRSDAQANYTRIVTAATDVIDREGPDAPLTTIAAEASVGIATLYRRFPTRDHLIEAVYRHRITTLCDSTADIIEAEPTAASALDLWMVRYVDLLIANRGVPDAIRHILAADPDFVNESRTNLTRALATLMEAGRRTHGFRDDYEPVDILRALTGIGFVSQSREHARRPLDLMMDGLTAPSRSSS